MSAQDIQDQLQAQRAYSVCRWDVYDTVHAADGWRPVYGWCEVDIIRAPSRRAAIAEARSLFPSRQLRVELAEV